MTVVPLPASPCVRVRLIYTNTDGSFAGSRFYLSYAEGSPTGANCTTLASDVAAAWETNIATLVNTGDSLTQVDVLDIATVLGLSGVWDGDNAGTSEGAPLPAQVAMNVEYDIARRYRGGKPRMFLPAPGDEAVATAGTWTTGVLTDTNAGMAAFFAELEALDIGAMGALAHVNLSYYSGFTNVTNSSGRTRAAPKYRAAALLDTVTGYSAKVEMGSQRRRRASTTP